MHDRHDLVQIVQTGYLKDFAACMIRFVDIHGKLELYSFYQLQAGRFLIQSMLHSIKENLSHQVEVVPIMKLFIIQ